MTRLLARPLLALLLVVALSGSGRAQGTPYVAMLDAAYEDLDALIASGLVRELMVGERPYSQASFRRFVLEAVRRRAGREASAGAASVRPASTRALSTRALSAREVEALARLEARFGGTPAKVGTAFQRAPFTGTVALASSPTRAMRVNGAPAGSQIDADLNPLLQRNQGRVLLDGLTASMEGGVTATRGPFAAEATARAWAGIPQGQPANAGLDLVAGYGRAVWGPVAFDLGRTAYVVGYGPYGGSMYSTNARALDQARLRAEYPVRLPWVLRHLGLWQGTFALANLGQNRDNRGGTLLTMRLTGRPSQYLEWGLTYQNQHDGTGVKPSHQYQRLEEIIFVFSGQEWQVTDRAVAAEVRLALPQTRSALYANFLSTDDRNRFRLHSGGYWEDAVWIGGFEQRGMGRDGRLDVRLEGRHTGPIPHSHGQFTSGMTEDQRTIGDAMGPNSEGLALTGTWNGSKSRLSVEAAIERYTIDIYAMFSSPTPRFGYGDDWRLAHDEPDEFRQRLTVSWMSHAAWRGYQPTVRAGYERIQRFNWVDKTRHAAVLELSLRPFR